MRVFGAMVIAALVALAPAGPAGSQNDPSVTELASDSASAALEAEFVGTINALRSSLGRPPLELHPELVEKARSWAATMSAEGRIWHSALGHGVAADWAKLGENVGKGPSVASLHAAFVASPSHYANLVRSDFTHVGVGVVVNPDGTLFVAEEFMILQPAADAEPANASAPVGSPAASAQGDDVVAPSAGSAGGATGTGAVADETAAGDAHAPTADSSSGDHDDAGAAVERLKTLLLRLRALDG